VVLSNGQATAVALWILQAWAHEDAAVHSPILLATSPEPGCGKTVLVDLISFLVPCGLPCVGLSEAALFRCIQKWKPTIIVDEADTALVENEPLRAVINSGWTRGFGTVRCIGDSHDPQYFPTFCPKILGMKGRQLPDTTMSRCVIIEMRRKIRSERVEYFQSIDDAGLAELRRKSFRWSMDNGRTLKDAKPGMPPDFENRLADNWRLMFAIADLVGGDWPQQARQAAVAVSQAADIGDQSLGIQLLRDIRHIFSVTLEYGSDQPVKHMPAADLVASNKLCLSERSATITIMISVAARQ
jgi:putative DNA primase/helicase